MEITFISTQRFVITGFCLTLVIVLYFWQVRPILAKRPEFYSFYHESEAFWQRKFEWMKVRWDLMVAAFMAMLPLLWNGLLDATIAISHLLADLLPAVAGLDLSELIMPAWLKTTIQIGAAVLPPLRAHFLTKKEG
jgi:hypothetical protein